MFFFNTFLIINLSNFLYNVLLGPTEILEINVVLGLIELFFLVFFLVLENKRAGLIPVFFRSYSHDFYNVEVKFYKNISHCNGIALSIFYEDCPNSYIDLLVSGSICGGFGFTVINDFFEFIFSFFSKSNNKTRTFYPIINFLFFLVLFFSLTALIPLNDIFISSVFSIFFISTVSLLVILFYSIINFKLNFLFFFLPGGAPKYLLKFLVIIEILSYLARAVSLPARLIANSVAGHLLIKIILGFGCLVYSGMPGFLKFIMYLPATACLILLILDILIIFLQTFVFIFLLSFYLNQAVYTGVNYAKNVNSIKRV